MKRPTNPTPLVLFLLLVSTLSVSAQGSLLTARRAATLHSLLNGDTDRDRDGFLGPVRRVKTEMVKLGNRGGKAVEGQRVVIEAVAYDIKGTKIENAYYPVPGSALTGKEVYKYDEKGNIVEMTMVNVDGSMLSKEVYSYELDAFGNWTKMTASVAVIESGKISYEPTEVTFRTISYYLDEATLARMSQPAILAPTLAAPQQVSLNSPTVASLNSASNPVPTGDTGRPSAPLPSGGALVKANMTTAADAFSLPIRTNGGDTMISMDGEAPPPAAAKPAPKPLLKPVTGGVLNGKAMMLPKPLYPQAAKSARASGVVSVEVVIDEKGRVIAAKAVEGHSLLRAACVLAAQGARFSPTLLSGQPVKVSGLINYSFALQ